MKLYCTSAFVLAATALPLISIVNGEEGGGIDSFDTKQQQHLRQNLGDAPKVCSDENNKEWHLKHMKVPEAWAYSEAKGKPSRGEGIVIAQIDSGYSEHQLFEGMFPDGEDPVKGMNMYSYIDHLRPERREHVEKLNDPRDYLDRAVWASHVELGFAHGTVVASAAMNRGTIKMKQDENLKKLDGLAPRGTAPKANLYSIRVVDNPAILPRNGRRLRKAFDLINSGTIAEENVHVISISLGSVTRIRGLERRIHKAMDDKNVIIVAAGGQVLRQLSNPVWPARYDRVVAVGGYQIAGLEDATLGDNYWERKMTWWESAIDGKKIDISGPAKDVCNGNADWYDSNKKVAHWNSDPPLEIKYYYEQNASGTSLATAFLGGIAALWLGHHGRDYLIDKFDKKNGIKLQEAFRKVLELTANQKGWDGKYDTSKYGHGMIDAEAIVKKDLDEVIKAIKEDRKSMMDVVRGGSIISNDILA